MQATRADKADYWHLGLLRARRHRPRSRAAEKRDELAAPHGASLKAKGHTLPHLRNAALCITAKTGRRWQRWVLAVL
jgi:hypothetical protein